MNFGSTYSAVARYANLWRRKREVILVSVLETGLPGIAQTAGSDRRFSTYWLSEFGLISDGWLGSISPLGIGPMHLSVEGLRP